MRRFWEYLRRTWQGEAAAPWMIYGSNFFTFALVAAFFSTMVPLFIVYGTSLPVGVKWVVLMLGVVSFVLSFLLIGRRERRKVSSRPPVRMVSFPPPPSNMWTKSSKWAAQVRVADALSSLVLLWAVGFLGLVLLGAVVDGWYSRGFPSYAGFGPVMIPAVGPLLVLVGAFIGAFLAVAAGVLYTPGTYRSAKVRYMAEVQDLVSPGVARVAEMRLKVVDLGRMMESLEALSRELAVAQKALTEEMESKGAEYSKQLGEIATQQKLLEVNKQGVDAVLAEWERKHQRDRRRDRAFAVTLGLATLVLGLIGGVVVGHVWGT